MKDMDGCIAVKEITGVAEVEEELGGCKFSVTTVSLALHLVGRAFIPPA